MKSFDIFGSCVSRDLFEIDQIKEVQCREYIARQTIQSALAAPILVQEEEFDGVSSKFQKKLLLNDFNKTTFTRLKQSSSDFLILDFVDERFHVIKIQNSIVTLSNELVTSNYLCNKKYKIINRQRFNPIYFKRVTLKQIREFAKKIREIYPEDHIIIHKARLVDKYIGKQGEIYAFAPNIIQNNKNINDILDRMYRWLGETLPNAHCIDFSDCFYADEAHKWGLDAVHYQKEYYLAVMAEIYKIVRSL